MNATPTMFEYQSTETVTSKDGLFLERLDTFMEKSLADIKAFAERECQPYSETRRHIAQWHAKYLFQSTPMPAPTHTFNTSDRPSQVHAVLRGASQILESLSAAAGVQSFLLAVDPYEHSDGGFLGGSLLGREFWRGMRGGGDTGARSLRMHCIAQFKKRDIHDVQTTTIERQPSASPAPKPGPAKSVKNDLYESVRSLLRTVSGVRNAEMKWTNPERLDAFGVRLVGWPEGVPAQNPSTLKVSQNKVLLDAIQSGLMYFERLSFGRPGDSKGCVKDETEGDGNDDFSWAYDPDAGLSSSSQEPQRAITTLPSSKVATKSHSPLQAQTLNESSEHTRNSWTLDLVSGNGTSCNAVYSWDDGLREPSSALEEEVWDDAAYTVVERPRKRPRGDREESLNQET